MNEQRQLKARLKLVEMAQDQTKLPIYILGGAIEYCILFGSAEEKEIAEQADKAIETTIQDLYKKRKENS